MQGFPVFCEKDGNKLAPTALKGEFNPWSGAVVKPKALEKVQCSVCGATYGKREVPKEFEEQVGRVWIGQ